MNIENTMNNSSVVVRKKKKKKNQESCIGTLTTKKRRTSSSSSTSTSSSSSFYHTIITHAKTIHGIDEPPNNNNCNIIIPIEILPLHLQCIQSCTTLIYEYTKHISNEPILSLYDNNNNNNNNCNNNNNNIMNNVNNSTSTTASTSIILNNTNASSSSSSSSSKIMETLFQRMDETIGSLQQQKESSPTDTSHTNSVHNNNNNNNNTVNATSINHETIIGKIEMTISSWVKSIHQYRRNNNNTNHNTNHSSSIHNNSTSSKGKNKPMSCTPSSNYHDVSITIMKHLIHILLFRKMPSSSSSSSSTTSSSSSIKYNHFVSQKRALSIMIYTLLIHFQSCQYYFFNDTTTKTITRTTAMSSSSSTLVITKSKQRMKQINNNNKMNTNNKKQNQVLVMVWMDTILSIQQIQQFNNNNNYHINSHNNNNNHNNNMNKNFTEEYITFLYESLYLLQSLYNQFDTTYPTLFVAIQRFEQQLSSIIIATTTKTTSMTSKLVVVPPTTTTTTTSNQQQHQNNNNSNVSTSNSIAQPSTSTILRTRTTTTNTTNTYLDNDDNHRISNMNIIELRRIRDSAIQQYDTIQTKIQRLIHQCDLYMNQLVPRLHNTTIPTTTTTLSFSSNTNTNNRKTTTTKASSTTTNTNTRPIDMKSEIYADPDHDIGDIDDDDIDWEDGCSNNDDNLPTSMEVVNKRNDDGTTIKNETFANDTKLVASLQESTADTNITHLQAVEHTIATMRSGVLYLQEDQLDIGFDPMKTDDNDTQIQQQQEQQYSLIIKNKLQKSVQRLCKFETKYISLWIHALTYSDHLRPKDLSVVVISSTNYNSTTVTSPATTPSLSIPLIRMKPSQIKEQERILQQCIALQSDIQIIIGSAKKLGITCIPSSSSRNRKNNLV